MSGLLEAGESSNGEIVVPQTLDVLEKANWTQKRGGLGGDIIRAIYKLLNLHDNDTEYATAVAEYLVNMEPEQFQSFARAAFPLRRRLERQMMLIEISVSKAMGIEPLYVGGSLREYK